ncbi:hypothetical protein D3C81_1549010 [compost metagenome]
MLVDLAGQAIVVAQVIEQMLNALDQALAAGVVEFLDRQGIEQGVGRRQGVVEQGEDKMRASSVVGVHLAFIDPVPDLLLPAQVGLQATTVEGVLAPGRVLEAGIAGVGLVQCIAKQYAPQLAAQGQGMLGCVQGMAQAVTCHAAQGRNQVAPPYAGNSALRIDVCGGRGDRSLRRFVFHGATLRRQAINKQINAKAAPSWALPSCCRLLVVGA